MQHALSMLSRHATAGESAVRVRLLRDSSRPHRSVISSSALRTCRVLKSDFRVSNAENIGPGSLQYSVSDNGASPKRMLHTFIITNT